MIIEREGVRLWAEAEGEASAPAVLLLAGNGASSVYWTDTFCAPLVAGGLRLVRCDYRDTGRSTHGSAAYDLDDLADDAIAILDALEIAGAHVVGWSMGGFLAQRLALDAPERVMSIASLMSTSDYAVMLHGFGGALPPPMSGLPPPRADWLAALGALPADLSPAELVVESWRLANGTKRPFDAALWRDLVTTAATRGDDDRAGELHRAACARSNRLDLRAELERLAVPALFIGGTEDPIFPPGHAAAGAERAPRGVLRMIDGLGHVLGPAHDAELAQIYLDFARAAR